MQLYKDKVAEKGAKVHLVRWRDCIDSANIPLWAIKYNFTGMLTTMVYSRSAHIVTPTK